MGLFRDINILSAPNNSTNVTTVTAQRGSGCGNDPRARVQKHRHHQHQSHKSTKHHCH